MVQFIGRKYPDHELQTTIPFTSLNHANINQNFEARVILDIHVTNKLQINNSSYEL